MPCEYKDVNFKGGCTQPVIYERVKGPTEWTEGDDRSAGKRSKGAPIHPQKSLNICYYHDKLKKGLFDGETYGRSSSYSKSGGRPRIHDPNR